jgi:hypothetical protein
MSPGNTDPVETIRIADLAEPVLSEAQRGVIEATASVAVDLSVDAVLSAACERTSLTDFGSDGFRERLDVWLQAIDEDDELRPVARIGLFNECVRYASNRARLQKLLREHPEIHDVEIERPVIIAGLPRSGTTHLLNLIASDRRLRSLPYWESLEPVPDPREAPGPDAEDPRLARCRAESATQDALLPLLMSMHHMSPEHVHEEIELQAIDFSSYILEWKAHVPRWRDYYLAHDQTEHYAYLKTALKALQWLRGPNRWILKSPQHMEQLPVLHKTFPDATIAITHRDPVSVIVSTATMMAYGDRLRRTKPDPPAVARYWVDRIEKILRACVRDRGRVPASQSIDVRFGDFMQDDVAVVEKIYGLAELPLTAEARASLEAFAAENRRGRKGQVVYDLEGDFGITEAELHERFRFYLEAFDLEES